MKIVPVKSSDLQRSFLYYTEVLDFERQGPGHEDREMANTVIDPVRDGVGCLIQTATVSVSARPLGN